MVMQSRESRAVQESLFQRKGCDATCKSSTDVSTGHFGPTVTEGQIRAELGTLFDIVQLREFRFDQVEGDGSRFLGWSCLLRRKSD